MNVPAPALEAAEAGGSAAAVDIGRPQTPSSRSSSPASDNIDEEQLPELFVSPKNTRVTRSGASGSTNAATTRASSSRQDGREPAAAGAGNKRGKAGHARANSNRDGQDFARRDNDAFDGEILPGHGPPGMNPLDRLLDIDYARDFGDPVVRYDALRNQPPQPMNHTPAAAPPPAPAVPTTAPAPVPEPASHPSAPVNPPTPPSEPAPTAAEPAQVTEGTIPEAPEADVKMDTTS